MSVAILMGSDSDLDVVSKAFDVLDSFDVKYSKNVLSAHRTPAAYNWQCCMSSNYTCKMSSHTCSRYKNFNAA